MSSFEKLDEFRTEDGHKLEKFILPNGLKTIIFEDRSSPLFAYHSWFSVGSRNEREGITGIAHLFEHLMFKATKNLPDGMFDKVMEENGGEINAGTYLDWTFYREVMPKEAFDIVPKLEADRMQNILLNEDQLNSEREVVANERRFRVDNNPAGAMSEELYRRAYTKHPYHWPILGWMKDIETISLQDCLDFYSRFYAPNNATVIVVGDVETKDVLEKIEEHYGSIPSSQLEEVNLPQEPDQTEERRLDIQQPISTTRFTMGYRVPSTGHTDIFALEALCAILTKGRSARLYRKLVSQDKKLTTIKSWVTHVLDSGLMTFDGSLRDGTDSDEALSLFDVEISKVQSNLVEPDELDRAKNLVETSFWKNFVKVDQKAMGLGFYETVLGDYRGIFSEVSNFQKVTLEDVQRVARMYLRPENRTIIFAKPMEEQKP